MRENNRKVNLILEQFGDTKEKSDLIDVIEAYKLLKISSSTIYKMSAKNTIPVIKQPGSRKLVFSRNDLKNWIKQPDLFKISIADDYLHKNLKIRKVQYN